MVADSKTEKHDLKGLPIFDSTNVVNCSKRLEIWLMRRNRNHLGLNEKPERPPQGAAAAVSGQLGVPQSGWYRLHWVSRAQGSPKG